eukprot:Plantae.Rhodophyta-Purpureofilum_apyrenoidigerum.ctg4436.p1 GENE.Plantae.Rhodophyta-Purpureofilum_apyrenoidigerum.ctg4436~~Plantae.Rhodophyta-Purpureofilum_apyrenoidigerum.ctg4436.p1  ORF type:complete len:486 (-),score=45.38 Plantae.Rhodophyta-Purpureofilum_apyrenoidigerum.ctg4436:643-2100(-)
MQEFRLKNKMQTSGLFFLLSIPPDTRMLASRRWRWRSFDRVRLARSTSTIVMAGYDPSFLGIEIPLPTFSQELRDAVLKDPTFENGTWTDYIHYSVATNTTRRQPICAALNIDQTKLRSVSRGGWNLDERIGPYQLDNDYYRNNVWDRGHLATRSLAAWGDTDREAKEASDSTMFYSNACLQHGNFNQDEWLYLEEWVRNQESDSNNRLTVFTGPVYGVPQVSTRFITPPGREPAEIPAGFFKILAFIDRSNKLSVRAFLLVQDEISLESSNRRADTRTFKLAMYQVTVRSVEEQTGLTFPSAIASQNPLFYSPRPEMEKLGVGSLPEVIPVDSPDDMVNSPSSPRNTSPEATSVVILAAMINAAGDERVNEWVTIANFGPRAINMSGWSLSDTKRDPLAIQGILYPGEALRIAPLQSQLQLSNAGGQIELLGPSGQVVDRVEYSRRGNDISEGFPTIFSVRRRPRSHNIHISPRTTLSLSRSKA